MSTKANVMISTPTASTISLTATTGCHMLKIEGYSLARLLGNGKRFESPKFKAAGYTWRIVFYLTDGNIISMYVKLVHILQNVTAEVQFSLLNQYSAKKTPAPYKDESISYIFRNPSYNNYYRYSLFVGPTKYIEQDGDSIVMRCDIKVLNKPKVYSLSLEKLGVICHCKDDTCERLHDTWSMVSAERSVKVN
uniref:MATH domain-containing protein n=1 Tax=Oryza brachyantha TaxID=4533 RepID=J3ND82_ORYBR